LHSAMAPSAASENSSQPGGSPEATPPMHPALQGYPNRFTLALPDQAFQSPRSGRKSGVQAFTDPMNPFARVTSKAITNLQEARNDPQRAGARTRNPGMIPVKEGPDRMQFAVYRYGHHEWRPGKRCPDKAASVAAASPCSDAAVPATPMPSPMSPRSSQGAAEALCTGGKVSAALGNYLNDMKRHRTSLRAMPGTPSAALRRMNDENFLLPAERNQTEGKVSRRSRSLSKDRCLHDQSTSTDVYGFARKRSVNGHWTSRSNRDFLYHREETNAAPTPRAERAQQADQRFQEVVAHMKETKPEVTRCVSAYKARNHCTGLLYNISPVLA